MCLTLLVFPLLICEPKDVHASYREFQSFYLRNEGCSLFRYLMDLIFTLIVNVIIYYYYYCFYLDTKENASVSDTLQKIWAVLEINLEQYALSLLR